jgi:hypothetical protein
MFRTDDLERESGPASKSKKVYSPPTCRTSVSTLTQLADLPFLLRSGVYSPWGSHPDLGCRLCPSSLGRLGSDQRSNVDGMLRIEAFLGDGKRLCTSMEAKEAAEIPSAIVSPLPTFLAQTSS